MAALPHHEPAPDPALPAAPAQPAPLAPPAQPALTLASLAVAIGFAVLVALMLSPLFATPFPELLGRTLFLSMALLLVYVAAQRTPQRWLPRWLPRWLFTMAAVGLTAPLGTALVYLVAVGGRFSDFVNSESRLVGFMIIGTLSMVLGLLITLTALVREREARARSQALQFELECSRLEKQAVDARLAVLQAQIEPHFLFNTLANVQALVESGSPRAAPVLQSLIAYLRAAMPRLQSAAPTLGHELALVRAYLELMQLRMPDRLAFSVAVPEALLGLRFPPMALLTLVENAVRHGIDPSEEGGRIEVGAAEGAGGVRAWVADTGVGLPASTQTGTGLSNLRARLEAFFGPGAALELSEQAPHGLRAEIVWQP